MLKIDNVKYNVLSSQIKFVNAKYNKLKGYSILVLINIELNEVKGYISFYVDFFNNNEFKNIENKEYNDSPNELCSKISVMEIFDTKNFIDSIYSNVIVKFGNIVNNQIEMDLKINDSLIQLEYQGLLDIN